METLKIIAAILVTLLGAITFLCIAYVSHYIIKPKLEKLVHKLFEKIK